MIDLGFQGKFQSLLERGSRELYEDYSDKMSSPKLLPSPNEIADEDLELFFIGIEKGLITIERGARFNTLDRPRAGGRWALLSRRKIGGWYNAEYLPQIAAYVHAIAELGYPKNRVFFELPDKALKLDLAVIDNSGKVVILGEAKRDLKMLDPLIDKVLNLYGDADPGKEGQNETRQLAWRLWKTRASFLWLIGPGDRRTFRMTYSPLTAKRLGKLPFAKDLNLDTPPPFNLEIPNFK